MAARVARSTENETAGVNLVKATPEVSTDSLYLREQRPHNLLRWDLTVEPTMTGLVAPCTAVTAAVVSSQTLTAHAVDH